jgi:hypothetical protein
MRLSLRWATAPQEKNISSSIIILYILQFITNITSFMGVEALHYKLEKVAGSIPDGTIGIFY